MKLLLISNSTNPGEAYLDYPKYNIRDFLGKEIKKVLFIPYAGVTFSWDAYRDKVQERFSEIGYQVDAIHHYENKEEAIEKAEAIVVGGGNTWQLLNEVQKNKLIEPIRRKVLNGTPYVGWSAGSNLACPTIRTTNDMPIIQPQSFNALNLIPFQINPHYLDANPEGHAGETREQRILEFIHINPNLYVVGLREATMLQLIDGKLELIGRRPMRIFRKGDEPYEVNPGSDLSFLLK